VITKNKDVYFIVSDHQHVREGLCLSLRMQQHVVVGTGDGVHAFSLLEERISAGDRIACLFLGNHLKFMSQVEFLLFCRSRFTSQLIPIIAQASEEKDLESSIVQESLKDAGADTIVKKTDLPSILKKILDFSQKILEERESQKNSLSSIS
jgi:CheY-like chemotaxis protein